MFNVLEHGGIIAAIQKQIAGCRAVMGEKDAGVGRQPQPVASEDSLSVTLDFGGRNFQISSVVPQDVLRSHKRFEVLAGN